MLNDGAPNVGAAWAKDAYSQNELVLHAAHIAALFLRRGGTFVSKVFRSRDYSTLISVLNQLFDRVDTTKPQASRHSSAEVFIVCLGYKAPQKPDPRLFDPKVVFASDSAHAGQAEAIDRDRHRVASLKELLARKPNRQGYDDSAPLLLYKPRPFNEFLRAEEPFAFLAAANSLTIE